MTQKYSLLLRRKIEVNTDPQRRCYDGVHASSEVRWTGWTAIDSGLSLEAVERRIAFWRNLNEYAVTQRGESARIEYKSRAEL